MIGGKAKIFYLKLSLFALLLLLFLFIIPLSMTLSCALTSAGDVFSSAYTYRVLSFTLFESFLSALISVLLSLPFAYFWSHHKFFMHSFVLSLSTLSFTIPSILVVLGFVIFYGRSGVLSDVLSHLLGREVKVKVLYSFFAIIFAHVYLNLPVAFNLIANGWEKIDPIYEESSYSLGRGKMRTFISVTLPMLKKEMARFAFDQPAAALHDLIRGMNPWPVAFFEYGGKKVKVLASRTAENPGGAPAGAVLATKPLTIACADGALQLLQVTPEGGKPMDGTAWAAGRRLKAGDSL